MIQKILHYRHRVTGEFLFETLKRYFLFVFGGLIGWVMLIGIHEFLQKQSGLHPAFSYGLGIIAADVFTFTYHSLITFRIKTGWQIRLMKFTFLLIGISAANWALFYVGRSILDVPLPDTVMSFFITGFLSVANFIVNKTIIFRHKKS